MNSEISKQLGVAGARAGSDVRREEAWSFSPRRGEFIVLRWNTRMHRKRACDVMGPGL